MDCSEKLTDDEEFELIGDVSDMMTRDDAAAAAAANGNSLCNNDGLSHHVTWLDLSLS